MQSDALKTAPPPPHAEWDQQLFGAGDAAGHRHALFNDWFGVIPPPAGVLHSLAEDTNSILLFTDVEDDFYFISI